jgi:hypothetical protein
MENKPFIELDDDRQWEIVRDDMGDHWHDSILEEIQGELVQYFENPEISYSGFWSQGDGASFTSTGIYLIQFFEDHWRKMDFPFTGTELEDLTEEEVDEIKEFTTPFPFIITFMRIQYH